ncbi:MAG: IPT/TIG domain-containing protein, partial [Elusimicrobia bacterium]|nr:IPT/TIG domain-containing protein [Elusimicrobiota bacterium]
AAAYGVAVSSQGLVLVMPSLYELQPSPVVFSPPATLTFRFDAVGVDTTTVSIYRFNGVTWDSAPVTSQQLVAVGGGLFDISGILQSASLYAVFSLPAPAPALASITVTPSSATLLAGTTAQFEVAGTFTDGSTRTLTGEVVWTTDVSSVATVAAGLATGVGGGTAQIIASSGAITGFATLTVTVPPVLTLSSIAPSSATTGTSFAASLTGTGFDASAALTLERLAVAQATWSATGSFTRGSYHGTLTKLRDGRVLLAGGRDPAVNGSYLTNADLYDPATGSWTAGPPMKVGRVLHASVLLADGRVLVTGGSDWPYNSVEIFDPVLSTWTAAAPLANGRSLHGAALLPDGRVLVASGWNGGTEMSSAEIYDPVADTWSPAPPLSTARRSAKMITLSDGKILLAGGEGVATAEVFNPVTNAWGPAGTMSHTRQLHQLALLPNGKVLAAGGWGPVGASSTTDVYDPATNAWTAVAPMGGPRGDHAMVLVNGTPLVIGGRNASAELASTEVYDAAADTWRAGPPLMGTRVVPTAATLADGRVLVAAGYRSNVGLNTAELLAPTVVSIVATGVSAADAQHLAGSFDLTGAATGYWDVVVHQTGGRVGRLEAGLNVLPAAPADVTVPVVSLSYSTPSFTASGGLVTIGTNSLVTLYAMDPSSAVPASGVAQILYAVDSTTPSVTYSAPFNLAAGAHVIYFSATDLAGNASAVSSAALSAAESPFVGAFSPSVGPIGIGYAMAGFGFGTYGGTATRVKFGISTTPVSVWNDASIVGTVPGLSTGTYAVTLERLSGSTLTITSAGAYTVTPMVPSLSVSSGPIGLPFTLTGTGFGTYAGANSRVLFAGTTAPISVWNDSTISGTVPGVAAGTTTVVVERRTADGFLAQSDPLPFTVTVPSVTAVSPSSAPIGAAFTLTGLSFGNYLGANSRVLFDGTTAPIAVWNDDTITGTVPGSLAPGVHELVVERRTADGGVSRSGGDAFVVQGLALASIAPSTGAIGVPFTLTGTGFGSYLGANSRVKFGVSTAAVSVWNDTTIAGTVPTLSTGEYSVTVERQQGSDVSVSNASSFTVIGLSIASVTPSSGPIGTVFTVSGAGFGPYAGVNTFLLLGGATTPVSVWNDTTITATVPGGLTPGVKELTAVRRNTDGGLSVSNTAYFEVTGMGIASLSPSTGPIGIPFTIKGSQFGVYLGANSRVRFGVSTAAVSVWNDTTITGTVPSLATGTHAVVLERQQGTEVTFSDYSSFTVTELAVGTLTPSSGPIGVAFTVTGEHFGIYAGANTRLLLGGTTVAVAVWNDTTITGTVPNLAAGSQPLWLERKSGTGVQSSATTYFLVTTPEVATLTPSSAPIGAPFSITGGNFGPYAGANTRVTFNGVSAPISVWNDHAISGTVPGAVSTGPAALVVERAAGAGVTQCATQAFEVLLPVISTVSPAFGPAGTVVTLTGRGFGPYAGTATKLLVGGSTVAVSVWNDTTIRWTVTAAFPNGDYALVVRRAPAGGTVDSDSATFTVGTGYGGASFGFAETLSLAAQPDVNFEGGLNLPVDEGGRVETPSKAAVEVPPNALEEDTEITLKRLHKDGLRTEASDTAKKRAAGEAIEFGPEGTFFNTPVTIELPYDPALTADESKLAVHYYDPLRRAWEELPSVVDRARRVVRAQTSHFSIYQPMGIAPTTAAQDEFYFRDQYAFPNPSRGGAVTFRIQPGLADTIELRVYDLSGRKIHGSTDFTFRGAIDDGNGKGAQNTYDHVWGVSGVGSGVYRYVIKASRASQAPIVKSGKVGVIK